MVCPLDPPFEAGGVPVVYTLGHSTHPLERLIELLRRHAVTAVGDVRSSPYSRRNPQYNRELLARALAAAGIEYLFLGNELGARSDDPSCYEGGKVRYERLACTAAFRRGLARVQEGAARSRLALMCAEKEPLECHRAILVARHLCARGIDVRHIHAGGALESHAEAVERLVARLGLAEDLFRAPQDVVREAYVVQGERIAYRRPQRGR